MDINDYLKWILSPMDKLDFLMSYWEKRPFYLSRRNKRYYKDLISLDTVDKILSRQDIFYPVVRIFENGKTILPKSFTTKFHFGFEEFHGLIDVNKVYKYYLKGATINFRVLERFHRPLMYLCRGMESQLGSGADVSVFLTPKHSGHNLKPHYDAVDAFILQISGKKKWRIWKSSYELPSMKQDYTPYNVQCNKENLEGIYVLEEGDMLYIPRGFPHDAVTEDSHSLHATVGVTTVTWFDIFSRLTANFTDKTNVSRISEADAFTSLLDKRKDSHLFSKLLDYFRSDLRLSDGIHLSKSILVTGRYPARYGQILDFVRLDELSLNTVLQKRKGVICMIERDSLTENIVIKFHDKSIKMPFFLWEPLKYIVSTSHSSFCVGDIPGSLDRKSCLVLCTRLVKEGLLTLVGEKNAEILNDSKKATNKLKSYDLLL